jgi:hypothetical protein
LNYANEIRLKVLKLISRTTPRKQIAKRIIIIIDCQEEEEEDGRNSIRSIANEKRRSKNPITLKSAALFIRFG